MRLATIVLLVFLGLSCQAPDRPTNFYHEVRAGIVLPSVRIQTQGGGSGSGVVVRRNGGKAMVLTAFHVVGAPDATVSVGRWMTNKAILADGRVVKHDIKNDLALVEVDLPLEATDVVTEEDLRESVKLLDNVVVYGYAMGFYRPTLTEGRIQEWDHHGKMRISAPVIYGNSGGGIFTKIGDHWVLVGVVHQVYVGPFGPVTHMALGTNPYVMLEFLR